MRALIAGLTLCLIFTLESAVVHAQQAGERIVRVQRVGAYHEVEIVGASDFPFGAMPLTLWIGGRSFTRYEHARGGDLKVVVFYLTPAQFNDVKSGDEVRVTYGPSQTSRKTWRIGTFNKDVGDLR